MMVALLRFFTGSPSCGFVDVKEAEKKREVPWNFFAPAVLLHHVSHTQESLAR
jgi:uncharacterized protein YbbK (DUF523 family)